MQFPLDKHIVDSICRQFGLRDFDELGNASIRQLAGVVKNIEQATGVEYVNMARSEEMGLGVRTRFRRSAASS